VEIYIWISHSCIWILGRPRSIDCVDLYPGPGDYIWMINIVCGGRLTDLYLDIVFWMQAFIGLDCGDNFSSGHRM